MRKILLTFLTALMGINVFAVDAGTPNELLDIDFADATATAYAENTARNLTTGIAGLTNVNQPKSSSCGVAINSSSGGNSANVTGKIQFYQNNTAKKWSMLYTTNLSTLNGSVTPTALKVKFSGVYYSHLDNNSDSATHVVFAIGEGFTSANAGTLPAASLVHSGFGFDNKYESKTKISRFHTYALGSGAARISETLLTLESNVDLYLFANNTGSALTYTGPDDNTYTVNNDCYEVWMGTTRIAANVAALTGTKALQNIAIGCPGSNTKKHDFRMSGLTVWDISPSSCTSITPTLSYASVGGTTLAIGGSSSGSPTVGGNTGSGAVTYAITATPSGCATINNSTGVVTGVHAGTATVTATVAANGDYCSGTATADFTISCNSITPTFSTDYTSTTLTVGGGNSSTPDVNKNGSSGAISWTSSAPAKATVNSSGVVTPVAAGSATITATVAANGDYCEGTVSKDFTINAAACSPSISASPSSASYCKDDDATALSFTGSGHNAQKWQYYDGDSWEDIDGATNATYTPSTSATGSTQYRVVTTCDSYTTTATSSAATITVKTSPNLTITLN